jgi:hypothetical protein
MVTIVDPDGGPTLDVTPMGLSILIDWIAMEPGSDEVYFYLGSNMISQLSAITGIIL